MTTRKNAPPGDAEIKARDASVADYWQQLAASPHQHDLFHTLRWFSARHPEKPRLGSALRPRDEALRTGQDPSLAFAPATLAHVQPARGARPARIGNWAFGLFGPNGPLPIHLTEFARERLRLHADPAMVGFADIFHHRAILLFFRAWADAQTTCSLDRSADDHFSRFVDSLIGWGEASHRDRDTLPDHARRYGAPHLVRQTRNPEGLEQLLGKFFDAPVQLIEYRDSWLDIAPELQTRLGGFDGNNALGQTSVLGARAPDVQFRFRLRMGPLPLQTYLELLPVQRSLRQLVDWVRNYVGQEFAWDVVLVLKRSEVPACTLGGTSRLGWTSWLVKEERTRDPDDLTLDPEYHVRARRPASPASTGARTAL